MKIKKSGFALIELLAVIATIIVLAALLLPALKLAEAKKQMRVAAAAQAATNAATNATRVKMNAQPHPVNFGHNIFYFTNVGLEFPRAVSMFLDIHTNLDVETWVSDIQRQNRGGDLSSSDYGASVGYTVVFKEKPMVFYPVPVQVPAENSVPRGH
jgi:type II secretory pathway pseudopilin PulG